jgi:outer membrane immunogenic protein
MRKQLLCSAAVIAIITAVGGPVSAADMRARPVYKAPPPVPAIYTMYNWTGLYIGGHIGYGSAKFEFNTGIDSGSRSSLIGGGQLGFNWQAGSVVWGLEGDVSGASFSAGRQVSTIGAKVDLLASLRGRLGLAFDRILVYGTGGVGYVHGKAGAQTLGTVLTLNFGSSRGVVGGGVEWAASNNLTFRIEALDYLGSTSFDLGGDVNNNIRDIWVTRVGASYKLDWLGIGKGKSPIVARY